MATLRILDTVWDRLSRHLESSPEEHFAFLLARYSTSLAKPVLLAQDVVLVPDHRVGWTDGGYAIELEVVIDAINLARSGSWALIEVHNHLGPRPRFSGIDHRGLSETAPYMLDSLPGRPYAALVYGEGAVYGEAFEPGRRQQFRQVTVVGQCLRPVISRDDDEVTPEAKFDRQLAWLTVPGQRRLGRLRVAIGGLGGTGALVAQNLAYVGVLDFVLIDDDLADITSLNRLATADYGDTGIPKVRLAADLILRVAPHARVKIVSTKVQAAEALDAVLSADLLIGCFDNDAPRMIWNELAVAYHLPYLDVGVGVCTTNGRLDSAGGRFAFVLPAGPCLRCMQQIDVDEARYFLATPEQQLVARQRRYIDGVDEPAPSIMPVNTTVVGMAMVELAMLVSESRPVQAFGEYDALGVGRTRKGQWATPVAHSRRPGCIVCDQAGSADASGVVRRYGNLDGGRRSMQQTG